MTIAHVVHLIDGKTAATERITGVSDLDAKHKGIARMHQWAAEIDPVGKARANEEGTDPFGWVICNETPAWITITTPDVNHSLIVIF